MRRGFKSSKFYKECISSLALLPHRNFDVFKNESISPRILHPNSQKFHHLLSFTSSLSFSSKIVSSNAFYGQSRMLMRKNVNNDVSKDSPTPRGNMQLVIYGSRPLYARQLYEVCLQGIMVVVFIILDWIFVFIQKNYHDFRQAHLKDGIGHSLQTCIFFFLFFFNLCL